MFRLPWQPAAPEPAGRAPAAPAEAARTAPAEPPAVRTLYAARQPIFGRDSTVQAYEILFRSGPENRFTATDPEHASAASIEQSASAFGLDTLVGDRRAFVNFTRGALLGGYHKLLPRERTVIELLENIQPDREVLEACRQARADGYQLALDDYVFAPGSAPLLEVVDLVKVDFRLAARARDAAALEPLRRRGIRLLAEKVETHEEHRLALAAGYDLMQGYFFAKPQMVETRDLPPSKLTVLRFLSEVSRVDLSFQRLEELFRQDVGLTVRLLRYLNSAAFGWRHEVPSIGHALSLMGQNPLRKWAMMMGMLSLCDDHPHELSVTALSRARFAERIAPPSGLAQHEHELFLSGMLSLVDTMLGRPMPEVLTSLAVPPSVSAALLEGQVPLGPALQLVTAYQQGDWKSVDAARETCPVDDGALDAAYVDSLAWAEATADG